MKTILSYAILQCMWHENILKELRKSIKVHNKDMEKELYFII